MGRFGDYVSNTRFSQINHELHGISYTIFDEQVIYRGPNSIIFKVRNTAINVIDVAKYIPIQGLYTKDEKKAIEDILQSHDNIINMKGKPYFLGYNAKIVCPEYIILIMNYCENGSISSYIENRQGDFMEEELIQDIIYQSLLALQSLNKLGMCHGNLKPNNILFDKNRSILLSDLRFQLYPNTLNSNIQMVPLYNTKYIPFELLSDRQCTINSDIYTLCVILIELAFSSKLTSNINLLKLNGDLVDILYKNSPFYSEDMISFLKFIMNFVHNSLISGDHYLIDINKIISHKWLQSMANRKIRPAPQPHKALTRSRILTNTEMVDPRSDFWRDACTKYPILFTLSPPQEKYDEVVKTGDFNDVLRNASIKNEFLLLLHGSRSFSIGNLDLNVTSCEFWDNLLSLLMIFNDTTAIRIWNSSISNYGHSNITRSLSKFPELKKFIFTGNKLKDNALDELCSNFKNLSHLQELHLFFNALTDRSGILLANSFQYWSELKVLLLNENNIGDDGLTELASQLYRLTNLIRLDLSKNKLTDKSGKVLIDNLKKNQSLKSVKLTGNILTKAVIADLHKHYTTIDFGYDRAEYASKSSFFCS